MRLAHTTSSFFCVFRSSYIRTATTSSSFVLR